MLRDRSREIITVNYSKAKEKIFLGIILLALIIFVVMIGMIDKRIHYIDNSACSKELRNSDSAYLLDPDFELTEENLEKSIQDFICAPGYLKYKGHKSLIAPDGYCIIEARAKELWSQAFENIKCMPTYSDKDERQNRIKYDSFAFQNSIGELIVFRCINGDTMIYLDLFFHDWKKSNQRQYFRTNGEIYRNVKNTFRDSYLRKKSFINADPESWEI